MNRKEQISYDLLPIMPANAWRKWLNEGYNRDVAKLHSSDKRNKLRIDFRYEEWSMAGTSHFALREMMSMREPSTSAELLKWET